MRYMNWPMLPGTQMQGTPGDDSTKVRPLHTSSPCRKYPRYRLLHLRRLRAGRPGGQPARLVRVVRATRPVPASAVAHREGLPGVQEGNHQRRQENGVRVRGVTAPNWQSEDGRVRLFCGDCRDVLPTLEDGSIDAVVTDPPYGHNNNNGDLIARREEALGGGRGTSPVEAFRPIANDGPEANDLYRVSLPHWFRLLKPGCCCCCCGGGGGPDPQFARWSLWLAEVFDFKQMVVWDKGPMGMGWHYRRSYETVLVGQKPGASCKWYAERQNVENIIRPGQYGIRKIIPSADDHPTPKPVALAEHFIRLHTAPGDVVLDPFAGHGWVGVACVRTGRRFIGVELDPDYCAVAVRRIQAELRQPQLALETDAAPSQCANSERGGPDSSAEGGPQCPE